MAQRQASQQARPGHGQGCWGAKVLPWATHGAIARSVPPAAGRKGWFPAIHAMHTTVHFDACQATVHPDAWQRMLQAPHGGYALGRCKDPGAQSSSMPSSGIRHYEIANCLPWPSDGPDPLHVPLLGLVPCGLQVVGVVVPVTDMEPEDAVQGLPLFVRELMQEKVFLGAIPNEDGRNVRFRTFRFQGPRLHSGGCVEVGHSVAVLQIPMLFEARMLVQFAFPEPPPDSSEGSGPIVCAVENVLHHLVSDRLQVVRVPSVKC